MVSLTQEARAEIPTVNAIADGFKVVPTRFGPVFYCADCDAPVQP